MLHYANMPKIVDCSYDPINDRESIKFQIPASRLQAFIYISTRADVEELKAWACVLIGREFDLPRCIEFQLDLSIDPELPYIILIFGPAWYTEEGRDSYSKYSFLPQGVAQ